MRSWTWLISSCASCWFPSISDTLLRTDAATA